MSCTVIAIPYALAWVVGAIATAAVSSIEAKKAIDSDCWTDIVNPNNENCTEDVVITEKHFIEKTFETPFTDKEILMKTLTEHGVTNITEWENGLSGEIDKYKLNFEKTAADKPYNLKIFCLENENAEEKVGDLNNEYALNVQEDAYLHIIDKLKENNMQVEDEEVMDDNTIVLTVNIE